MSTVFSNFCIYSQFYNQHFIFNALQDWVFRKCMHTFSNHTDFLESSQRLIVTTPGSHFVSTKIQVTNKPVKNIDKYEQFLYVGTDFKSKWEQITEYLASKRSKWINEYPLKERILYCFWKLFFKKQYNSYHSDRFSDIKMHLQITAADIREGQLTLVWKSSRWYRISFHIPLCQLKSWHSPWQCIQNKSGTLWLAFIHDFLFAHCIQLTNDLLDK